MKIVTWNVNGIRSIFGKGFLDWMKKENPDIVCIQEIKANVEDLGDEYKKIDGYYAYFSSAKKKGYAGVAVYTKIKPQKVEAVLGIPRFDDEGRCLKLTFKDFILFNFYIPNGARDKKDMAHKLESYQQIFTLLKKLSQKNILLAGDFNIAHTELDLYHPEGNENSTMFTPDERKQLDVLHELGFVDTFRAQYPNERKYTWWAYWRNSRERDAGWRIDYIFLKGPMGKDVKNCFMRREVLGSDHGPYGIVLNKKFT